MRVAVNSWSISSMRSKDRLPATVVKNGDVETFLALKSRTQLISMSNPSSALGLLAWIEGKGRPPFSRSSLTLDAANRSSSIFLLLKQASRLVTRSSLRLFIDDDWSDKLLGSKDGFWLSGPLLPDEEALLKPEKHFPAARGLDVV